MKTVESQPPFTHVVRNSSEVISVMQSSRQCGECLQSSQSELWQSELQLGKILASTDLYSLFLCWAKALDIKMLTQNVEFLAGLWFKGMWNVAVETQTHVFLMANEREGKKKKKIFKDAVLLGLSSQ